MERVIMDYDGEPVYFENGRMLDAMPPTSRYTWNSEYCEWEFQNDPDEPNWDAMPGGYDWQFDWQ